MKRLIFVLLFGLLGIAPAQAACPAYPFTLQNGQVGDANQVMSNFNSILGCVNTGLANAPINTNITQLTGLTTPLSTTQGGTGLNSTTASSIFTTNSGGTPQWSALGASSVLTTNGSKVLTFTSPSGVLDLIGSGQGSILYRGASAWQVLSPGTAGQVLTANGVAAPSWGAAGGVGFAGVQIFTTPGANTWSAPANCCSKVVVESIGAGGASTSIAAGPAAASGAGAGGYSLCALNSPSSPQTVTVGAGGSGAGAQTTFGALCTALGGLTANITSTTPPTAAANTANQGSAGTSDASHVYVGGSVGSPGFTLSSTVAVGGNGGSTKYGVGGFGQVRTTTGSSSGGACNGFGSGGGGGAAIGANATVTVNGCGGLVIVWQYF